MGRFGLATSTGLSQALKVRQPGDDQKETITNRTIGPEVASNMLAEFEAGTTRADIAAEAEVSESCV